MVQVAPLDAMFAVEMIREYLQREGAVIRAADHGLGRLEIVKGEIPVSVYSPVIVQPLQGAGPDWLVTPRIEGPLPSGKNTPSLSQPGASD